VLRRLEKGEQIADIHHYVRFTHNSICTTCKNSDGIKESAKSENKVFV
jgi:hypothetical protein